MRIGTDDLSQDGATHDKLPDYVLHYLGQTLRNRLRYIIFAPLPELIESLLLILDNDEPRSEQGRGVAARGCGRDM